MTSHIFFLHKMRRFTVTSYSEAPPAFDNEFLSYLCYQQEKCPTTERLHWQVYLETSSRRSPNVVRKRYSPAHVEVSQGTAAQNREYCSKCESAVPGTFEEFGTPMSQGARTDLTEYITDVRSGMKLKQRLERYPDIEARYRHLHSLVLMAETEEYENKIRSDLKVYFFCGPSGSGKTRRVYQERPDVYRPTVQGKSVWWQNYRGQSAILLDDITPDFDRTALLHITDIYPYPLNVKGSHSYAAWTTVYITTNYQLCEFDPALKRRVICEHIPP